MAETRKWMPRWLVTLLALAAAWGAGHVTLPGVDRNMLEQVVRAAGRARLTGFEQLSVVALGLMPALSGFVLVELAALIVPRWRPLRTGGPEGRASLRVSAVTVTLGLAAIQGWFVAVWLESFSWRYGMYGELVRDPGLSSRLVITVTLIAGTCLMLALAWLIDRHGLGSGFAVMIASAALPYAFDLGEHAYLGVEQGMMDLTDVIALLLRLGIIG